ncbi:sodium- and chloride-dependent glycine transporter 1-like isoform X2 [Apostichopus japonicus]|uniref:sodium- and chloride-dependent glycine transporter 1-like isoform X2 n=1 Tax=Stichopus japonicus TaxID=307972 RepID=UPI003AB13346
MSYQKEKEAESNYDLMTNTPIQDKEAEGDENLERGNWSNHLDFLLSCVSYAVGLGNVWRFPYLCYSNGGGAFLIPYCIMLCFAGMPLFFLELSYGQYSSRGPISVWQSVPLLRGVGYGMVVTSGIVAVYYNVIITYCIFYMFKSMTKSLPWVGCDHEWNSEYCSEIYDDCIKEGGIITNDNLCQQVANMTMEEKADYNITEDGSLENYVDPFALSRSRPSEDFYRYGVLQDSGDAGNFGHIVWQLALCLLLAWTIVFICLARGVKSSGKVVYFTALFPYVVLTILLVRGLTLEGSIDGIIFFIKPRWELLANPKVWKDAAVQIFFSLSASWGGLITLSSYNKFHNNCMRDAIIVPILNCATSIFAGFVIFSIMGFMANKLGKDVSEVVEEQFGLAFIAYPEAVAQLPISPLWAFLFFFMLITLGFGSQICIVETVVTSVVDEFPQLLRKWKPLVLFAYCAFAFFFGLLCVTQAGNYWVILMDKYAADFALLIFGLCECIALGWLYGYKRFTNDIRTMVGDRIVDNVFFKWWPLNWCALTPAVLSFVLLFSLISWRPPTAGTYEFPVGCHVFGWFLVFCCLIWIPVVMIYEVFVRASGSISERVLDAIHSRDSWGPDLPAHRREAVETHKANGTEFSGNPDYRSPRISQGTEMKNRSGNESV